MVDKVVNRVVAVKGMRPHPRNYQEHSEGQLEDLRLSLQRFGQVRSIVVQRDGEDGFLLVAGHGVWEAARREGLKKLRADVIPVGWPEEKVLAYLAADNELARQSDPDEAQLAALVVDVAGIDEELARLAAGAEERLEELRRLAERAAPGEDPGPQLDRAAELQEKWGTAIGQIWQLGEHRLAVGDCTDKAVVEAVMKGENAKLLFTSPPYVQQRDYTAASDVSDWDKLMMGAFAIAPMAKDGQILVNLGLVHHDGEWQPYWQDWIEWMREQGWRRFGWYVWDQGPGLPGDWAGRFAPSFEFVFHFNRISVHPQKTQECKQAGLIYMGKGGLRGRDGEVSDWTHRGRPVQPVKIPDSVCRVSREKSSYLYEHPAMFSEGFAEYFISAWMGIVYEPFSGSGTTLIACEQLGRKCRAIEIEPKYCAVTIQRWVDLTGKEPKLLP